MNKLPFLFFALLLSFSSPISLLAQDHKAILVETIAEKHIWLYSYAAENTVTLNLSENMWEKVLGEEMHPKGYSTIKRVGKAFVDLSDKFGETNLEKKCGFSVNTVDEMDNREGCKQAIDSWGKKYSLTVNAASVAASRDAFKMVMGYVSSVAIYLEDGSSAIWHHGYVPKHPEMHVVINADNKYKAVDVSWSTDGKTVTINGPADIETAGWDGKIETGLKKGWKAG